LELERTAAALAPSNPGPYGSEAGHLYDVRDEAGLQQLKARVAGAHIDVSTYEEARRLQASPERDERRRAGALSGIKRLDAALQQAKGKKAADTRAALLVARAWLSADVARA